MADAYKVKYLGGETGSGQSVTHPLPHHDPRAADTLPDCLIPLHLGSFGSIIMGHILRSTKVMKWLPSHTFYRTVTGGSGARLPGRAADGHPPTHQANTPVQGCLANEYLTRRLGEVLWRPGRSVVPMSMEWGGGHRSTGLKSGITQYDDISDKQIL